MSEQAKVEFIARITDGDGKVIEKKVSGTAFPSSDSFDVTTREGFLSAFNVLEQSVLDARNKVGQEVTTEFLELVSKKNEMGKT